MFKRISIWIVALALVTLVAPRDASAQYKVIVNAGSGVTAISKADLSKIFQKKDRNLPDGTAAVPVDQASGAAVRAAFSDDVHGRGVSAIESYWQQQIFAGKDVPPETKASDAEVIAFVSSTPGGIGYVSAGAALSGGVKEVTVN